MAAKRKIVKKKVGPSNDVTDIKKNNKTNKKPLFSQFLDWKKSLRPLSPHRSFRRTYRRYSIRSLELPGYIAFTVEVWRVMRRHRSTFIWLVLAYAALSAFFVGFASQSAYTQLSGLIRSSSGEGSVERVADAGLLLVSGASGAVSPETDGVQQLIGGLLVLVVWLTTIWLLRAFLAGHAPRLRDGFYNSGTPFVPTIVLCFVLTLQLLPAAIAAIAISAATSSGLVNGGIEALLLWVVALLLVVLSLYWIVSTLIALVVVTLPGMYPLQALKTGNELTIGRRLRILLRMLWLLFIIIAVWICVVIPIILIDAWIKNLLPATAWLPIVPVTFLLVNSASVVLAASYIYLLYRKVVDDDAAPA
jgi:hypothetical protein